MTTAAPGGVISQDGRPQGRFALRVRALPRALAILALCLGTGLAAWAQELPPVPTAWFNDYAGLVPVEDARRLDEKLRRLDREESTQVVVAVFPRLPWPSLEDVTARTAESWKVGREGLDNGAILFVFVEDRQMRIEVGYGLEGALPDALAGRILDNEVVPRFRQGDVVGGLEAGIDGIVAAVRGEYTAPPPPERRGPPRSAIVIIVIFVIVFLLLVKFGSPGGSAGRTYGPRGRRRDRSHWGRGHWTGGGWGGGGWGGGSSWGGGGGFGGGGGGFMGGGGSFGGGGASSSW
jgi:uncharacterized protein